MLKRAKMRLTFVVLVLCSVGRSAAASGFEARRWLVVAEAGGTMTPGLNLGGLASLSLCRRIVLGVEVEATLAYETFRYANGLRVGARAGYAWRWGRIGVLAGFRIGSDWRRTVKGILGTIDAAAFMVAFEPELRLHLGQRYLVRLRLGTPVLLYSALWLIAWDASLGIGLWF